MDCLSLWYESQALETDLLLAFTRDVTLDIYLQKSLKHPNSKFQAFTVKLRARVV